MGSQRIFEGLMFLTSATDDEPWIDLPRGLQRDHLIGMERPSLKCQKNQMSPVVPDPLLAAVDNESGVWNRQLVVIFEKLVEALDQIHQA